MPTNNNLAERIAAMKSACEAMQTDIQCDCPDCAKIIRRYNDTVTPAAVLALIAHVEQLERETLTVEAALVKLRAMFPNAAVSVQFATDGRSQWCYLRRRNKAVASGKSLPEAVQALAQHTATEGRGEG